jgi:hypothetical protein
MTKGKYHSCQLASLEALEAAIVYASDDRTREVR